MTQNTPRTLDCGKTIEELSIYLSHDRIPFNPHIETCPECLNALEALDRVSQLSRDLLEQDIAHLPPPPAGWMDAIMTNIHADVRAGRSIPLTHPDPRVMITVTEGALRALLRSVADDIPGIIAGKTQIDGDVETPGAPVEVTITASILWGTSAQAVSQDLRQRIYNALTEHTDLNVHAVNVTIEDVHGHDPTPPPEQP